MQQRSKSDCIQGSTWGYDQSGIGVDRGCRADFIVEPNERPSNDGGQKPPIEGQTISCSSDDGGKHHCNAETRGGVQLTKQRRTSACQQDDSWGYDERGIWVDHGCRAEFVTGAGGDYGAAGSAVGRAVGRAGETRANELVRQCLEVSPGTHPPCNAQNSCKRITDEIRRGCEMPSAEVMRRRFAMTTDSKRICAGGRRDAGGTNGQNVGAPTFKVLLEGSDFAQAAVRRIAPLLRAADRPVLPTPGLRAPG